MRDASGFTLVEVLVAGFVLAVALLGIASMCLTAYEQLDRSREHTSATTLAQQRVEWLRNQDYTSPALFARTTTELLAGTYEGYTRTTTVVDDTPRAGVKQITVSTSTPAGTTARVLALIAKP